MPTATNTLSNTKKMIQNAESATPGLPSAISLPLRNKIKKNSANMSSFTTVMAVLGTLFGLSFVVAFVVYYTRWQHQARQQRWKIKSHEWSAHALDEGFFKLLDHQMKDKGAKDLADAVQSWPAWSANPQPLKFEGETYHYYLELERGFGDSLRRCHTSGLFFLLDSLRPKEKVLCLTYCHNESAVSLLRHHRHADQLKIIEIPMFVPYRTLEVLFPSVSAQLSQNVHEDHVRQLVSNYGYFLRHRPAEWALRRGSPPEAVAPFARYVIFTRLAGETRREIPLPLSRRIVQALLNLDPDLHVVHLSAKPQKRIIHDAVPDEVESEQSLLQHTRYHFWQDKFDNIYDTLGLFATAEAAVLTLSALSNAATMYEIPSFLLVPDHATYENVQRFGHGYFALEYEEEPLKYPHCVFRDFRTDRLRDWRERAWPSPRNTSSSSGTS